jgi:hypothetical protein
MQEKEKREEKRGEEIYSIPVHCSCAIGPFPVASAGSDTSPT